jgi:hypothetical protein
MIGRKRICVAVTLLFSWMIGCVERTMQVTTNPPGALVYMNNQEVGRTPLRRDFTWYGNYDVQVRAEGYETLDTNTWVTAPWWQWPPFDLVAELLPIRLKDERRVSYALEPASTQPVEPGAILSRAAEMRGKLESSAVARPAANPTTQPSSNAR